MISRQRTRQQRRQENLRTPYPSATARGVSSLIAPVVHTHLTTYTLLHSVAWTHQIERLELMKDFPAAARFDLP